MCFGKTFVRYAVIAGLVGGTALVVAGPERLSALATQTRSHITCAIDKHIEDPIALRAQLKSLEGTYPQRIAEVRGDLAELKEQKAQLQRELEVSNRVTELSSRDLDTLEAMIAKAESVTDSGVRLTSSNGEFQAMPTVRLAFNGESLDLKDAYGRGQKIRQVHNAYANRAADIERDLGYLNTQEERLTKLSEQLTTEHQDFQAQMWALDRQVDSIARNDRMIGMMEKRQRTIDEQSRYSANSLDQLQGRFADIRAKQEAKLETLGGVSTGVNYEDRAKVDIDTRKSFKPDSDTIKPSSFNKRLTKGAVIHITPEDIKTPATPTIAENAQ